MVDSREDVYMSGASKFRLRYSGKLFMSHLLAVFLVSGSVGTFFYLRAMDNLVRSLKSRLKNSARPGSRVTCARMSSVICVSSRTFRACRNFDG